METLAVVCSDVPWNGGGCAVGYGPKIPSPRAANLDGSGEGEGTVIRHPNGMELALVRVVA